MTINDLWITSVWPLGGLVLKCQRPKGFRGRSSDTFMSVQFWFFSLNDRILSTRFVWPTFRPKYQAKWVISVTGLSIWRLTLMLIDKRWSVTSTSNFQNVWNWSLNSWFLRIELTVTFDRLTLFHLIDGIWNIPKFKVISWTDFWIGPFIPDHAPNLGLVWAWTKPRIYVPKWKDHTYGVMIICRKYLFSQFLWFSSFSRFEILKTTFWYFKILPLFWNIRFCFKVRKLTFRKNLPFCWKKFG